MTPRWMLTTFFRDDQDRLTPVASAYGHAYRAVMNPATDDGSALIEIWAGAHQIEAAKQDPRITVCPPIFDPSPLPASIINAYSQYGATSTMSLGALLSLLSDVEPIFSHTFL